MQKYRLGSAGAVSLLVWSIVVPAQAVVVPNAYDNTPGTSTFVGPLAIGARTYQLLIHESQLTDLVGQPLGAVTWRLPPSATSDWPAADATFPNFDIYLSGSVDPSQRSLTFANNVVGPQTQVRSGPLTILAGSFKSGASPNDFGVDIAFTSPYVYSGGNLLIEVRHDGNNVGSRSLDALSTSTAGYGTLVSAAWQSSYTATSGAQGNFSITQLSVVPEPGFIVAGLSAVAMLALRRRGTAHSHC